MADWIKMADAKPQERGLYLTLSDPEDYGTVDVDYWEDGWTLPGEEVTHWTPLPEMPNV